MMSRFPVSMLLVRWRVLVVGACTGIERWKGLFLGGACSLVGWLDERLAGRLFKPVGVKLSPMRRIALWRPAPRHPAPRSMWRIVYSRVDPIGVNLRIV